MSNHTTPAEANRAAALEWIDAFNARDDRREAELRTADYIAHSRTDRNRNVRPREDSNL